MEEEAASESASVTVRRMEKGSHDWVLKNYSRRSKGIGVKKPIQSDEFTVGGHRWTIYLYPNGAKVEATNAGDASLYLCLKSKDFVHFFYNLYLVDQSGEGNHRARLNHQKVACLKGGFMCGYNDFVKRQVLQLPRYLKDDCLKFRCTISVLTCRVQNLPLIKIPESNIVADFGKLLERKESADVLFKVGDEIFWGHKWILVASSPVFRSRLSSCHQFQEEIVISDMEPRIFKAMLRFIYAGTLEEEEQKAFSYYGSFMLTSFMGKMLAAADQFELTKLKKTCESRILGKLSGDSVAYLLHLADLYHATDLKAACLRFAAENLDAVLESDGCEYLKQTCPSLFLELAYRKPSSSRGELDFCIKILSAVKEPFVSLFSSLGASDTKHKAKDV